MNDTMKPTGCATTHLASAFYRILEENPLLRFKEFEARILSVGHAVNCRPTAGEKIRR